MSGQEFNKRVTIVASTSNISLQVMLREVSPRLRRVVAPVVRASALQFSGRKTHYGPVEESGPDRGFIGTTRPPQQAANPQGSIL